jgi:hypothetical protein
MPRLPWKTSMAEAFAWQLTGRNPHALAPGDWRERLAARLGHRPRRLGVHAELAAFGALEALAASGESSLPDATLLRVCSARGPASAVATVLEQAREGLPLPFAFLQAQPSQMLAALAGALRWQGDASFVVTADPLDLVTMAARQAGRRGLLLGWVDEAPALSEWLRFIPCETPPRAFAPATDCAQFSSGGARWIRLQDGRVAVA